MGKYSAEKVISLYKADACLKQLVQLPEFQKESFKGTLCNIYARLFW